jgi:hypothetical protein
LVFFSFGFHPLGGMRFYFFRKFHQSNFSGQNTKDMYMVFLAANLHRFEIQIFTDSSDVLKQFIFNHFINEWIPVLCTKDDMAVIKG